MGFNRVLNDDTLYKIACSYLNFDGSYRAYVNNYDYRRMDKLKISLLFAWG